MNTAMGCDRWARDGGIESRRAPRVGRCVFDRCMDSFLGRLGLSDVSPEQYDSRMCIIQIIKFHCICGNH